MCIFIITIIFINKYKGTRYYCVKLSGAHVDFDFIVIDLIDFN